MKKLLSILSVACISACSTTNFNAMVEQQGSVVVEVEKVELIEQYKAHLSDFYQILSVGLPESSMSSLESIKTEFTDVKLAACELNEECEALAYKNHIDQLHKFVYKNDLSNVEPLYFESSSSDHHLIEATGFYGYVGDESNRLVVFVDILDIERNPELEPHSYIKIHSIDAILYRQKLNSAAEFKAVGTMPYGKVISLNKPKTLKSLFYTVDLTDIEFTDYTIGLSIHLGGHDYEITTFGPKLLELDNVEEQEVESTLY